MDQEEVIVQNEVVGEDENDDYWQSKIAEALIVYNNTTVSNILDHSFEHDFLEAHLNRLDVDIPNHPNRLELQDAGILLHDYIQRFYTEFYNLVGFMIPLSDDHVNRMLTALTIEPMTSIKWDKCVDREDPRFDRIHTQFRQELIQFYTFVRENFMVREKVEESIVDRNHNVRGRCNALFRVNNSDNRNLMLFDWTRSAIMIRGSLSFRQKTLQMNIYKYILEKYQGKNIVKMCSVVFHADKKNYELFEIDDIGFRCECEMCLQNN